MNRPFTNRFIDLAASFQMKLSNPIAEPIARVPATQSLGHSMGPFFAGSVTTFVRKAL